MSKSKNLIDISNKEFNSWTVLNYYGNSKWKCKCQCGYIGLVDSYALRNDYSKKCYRCLRKKQRIDLTDKKFNDLTVKKHIYGNIWECVCKCKRIVQMSSNSIRNRNKHCINCSNRKYVGDMSGKYFYSVSRGAKRRNIEFNITKEYVWNLFSLQNRKCNLSDLELYFSDSTIDLDKGNWTASLDRINSSIGYIENNVQWLHKDINIMKWGFRQEYFIYLCKLISNLDKYIPEYRYDLPIGKYRKGNKTIIPGFFINQIQNGAAIRNIRFDTNVDELYELFIQQKGICVLSGIKLMFAYHVKNRSMTTASLDRINNNIHYTIKNLQWVHKDVNEIKRHYDQTYFINMCNLISTKHGDKS